MFIDLNELDGPWDKRYDVCVIGAGPAGITLALSLARKNITVALCEGGGLDFTNESQDSYIGTVIGDPYYDLDVARLRYLGGTSNHWNGVCCTFDEIDFDRSYLAEQFKWPIGKASIDPWLAAACDILEIEVPKDDELMSGDFGINAIHLQFPEPVRFGQKYRKELESSAKIDVFLNANLLRLTAEAGHVRVADFASYRDTQLAIGAGHFVFAMGGIENSRQLLWQQALSDDKIYPAHLPVGRYWMEHPLFNLGEALIDTRIASKGFFALTPQRQKNLGILNCQIRAAYQGKTATKRLVNELLCIAPTVGQWAADLAGRKLICGVSFGAQWEQEPRLTNRVALSSRERDRFGVPLAELHWEKSALDNTTLKLSIESFNDWIFKDNLGRLRFDDWVYQDYAYPEDGKMGSWHHMGGTRMSSSPQFGVVDSDCRVFGMHNLYMCGSSIFTTGGHTNPTLPIVQFSLRLADHLGS
jgi:choline dehydrogenase-like flavoprotein